MPTSIVLAIIKLGSLLFPVKIVNNKRDKDLFIKTWHTVWLEENYASEDDYIIEKYSKYDEYSTDMLVMFIGVLPIGTMRIITNNKEYGLPTLNDFVVKLDVRNKNISEVTLLTVVKRFRRKFLHLPFAVLMRALYRHTNKEKLDGLMIAADEKLYESLTSVVKLPFSQVGDAVFYEGSITVPAFMTMENFDSKFKESNLLIASYVGCS